MRLNKKLSSILPGSKVGLISPAGPVKEEQIQQGLDTLRQNGIQYEFGRHAFSDNELVSATVDERIQDIIHFLKREDIDAVWSLRGGYGSIQLINTFDYSLLELHPKLMIEFSDLTALQWAVFKKTGIPSFSGFTLTSQFFPENPFLPFGLEMLSGRRTDISDKDLKGHEIQVITIGEGEGTLIGGTLSMICSLCGTPYFIDKGDLIVFVEDIDEPLYRIDRYFQQLALMGFWSKVKGVILGRFLCDGKPLNVVPLLKPLLSTSIPIISNFPYGHLAECIPLPQGASIRIDTDPFDISWNPFIET